MLLKELLKYSSKIALRNAKGESLFYSDILSECEKISNFLKPQKNLILILCQNNFESIIAYISSLLQGSAILLSNADSHPDFINALKEKYRPDYIWQPKTNAQDNAIYNYGEYGLYDQDIARDQSCTCIVIINFR